MDLAERYAKRLFEHYRDDECKRSNEDWDGLSVNDRIFWFEEAARAAQAFSDVVKGSAVNKLTNEIKRQSAMHLMALLYSKSPA
jgi:hypothetical protein